MVKPVIAFFCLVFFWWAGMMLSPMLPIPFPAPLIGLLLLFAGLLVYGKVPSGLLVTSQFLLKHLSIFFVPAILSVVLMKDLLLSHFWAISVGLIVSTLVSLWLTARVCKAMEKKA